MIVIKYLVILYTFTDLFQTSTNHNHNYYNIEIFYMRHKIAY